jgi:glycosyltransferase involved in cell wall biosynthesis
VSDRSPATLLDRSRAARERPPAADGRPYRVAYLVSHPIQYQAPMLRHLAARPELDLTVLFLSDFSLRAYRDPGFGVPVRWDVPLLDGYGYRFLPSLGRRDRVTFWSPFARDLWRTLRRGRFDALWICGYAQQSVLRALAMAKLLGQVVLLRGDSHLMSANRSPARAWLKRRALPKLFRSIDGFLAVGTLNREYYRHYGVSEERIFHVPNAVDNDFFRAKAGEARKTREAFRAELGLQPGRPVILYASKLQAVKRPGDLLEAYRQLGGVASREPAPYLLLVGDGELRPSLEVSARDMGWSSIRFLGFKNQTELPRFYDLADVLVLPSQSETWGLVVNEVMNAGKPVIVSDRVGAAPDLVRDGENGFVAPVGQVGILADRLARLTSDRTLASRMGQESLTRISSWNFEADAAGLIECLQGTLLRSRRGKTAADSG